MVDTEVDEKVVVDVVVVVEVVVDVVVVVEVVAEVKIAEDVALDVVDKVVVDIIVEVADEEIVEKVVMDVFVRLEVVVKEDTLREPDEDCMSDDVVLDTPPEDVASDVGRIVEDDAIVPVVKLREGIVDDNEAACMEEKQNFHSHII